MSDRLRQKPPTSYLENMKLKIEKINVKIRKIL